MDKPQTAEVSKGDEIMRIKEVTEFVKGEIKHNEGAVIRIMRQCVAARESNKHAPKFSVELKMNAVGKYGRTPFISDEAKIEFANWLLDSRCDWNEVVAVFLKSIADTVEATSEEENSLV